MNVRASCEDIKEMKHFCQVNNPLSIVIIGGMGNFTGSFLAAGLTVLLPELLRFVGISDNIAANMRQIIYGFILVVVMLTGKNGIGDLFTGRKGQQPNM